jgi:Rrf2 family transcriptional regulator, nitric oxide-sensitive transcriptional repressor
MNRLNRKVEYALMALKFMASKPSSTLTSAKEISENLNLPFDATARVLQSMAHAGFLRVVQGAHGGYVIIKDLSQISFHQLVEVIEGPLEIARCLHGEGCELLHTCNIQSPMSVLNQKLVEFYQGLSLAEILRAGNMTASASSERVSQ